MVSPEADTRRLSMCEELLQRDKVSRQLFWLKDESLEDSSNLPAPHAIAQAIVEERRAAFAQFETLQTGLWGE